MCSMHTFLYKDVNYVTQINKNNHQLHPTADAITRQTAKSLVFLCNNANISSLKLKYQLLDYTAEQYKKYFFPCSFVFAPPHHCTLIIVLSFKQKMTDYASLEAKMFEPIRSHLD